MLAFGQSGRTAPNQQFDCRQALRGTDNCSGAAVYADFQAGLSL